MNYTVLDNYLPAEKHQSLVNMVEHRDFEWYYLKGIITGDDGLFMFNHRFYNSDHGNIKESRYFPLLDELLLQSLKYTKLFRVKCNLYTKQNKVILGKWHTDHTHAHKTALYYINTNNGYTELGNGVQVNSVANRLLLLNEPIAHRIINQTDTPLRQNINITYL